MTQEMVVVGDRVLIKPDGENDKTDAGLYLPQGVKEREKIQSGRIIKTGPGIPMPDPQSVDEEPWKTTYRKDAKYLPLQAQKNDHAIFLRNSAIEIEFKGTTYIIVPHSALLILIRDRIDHMIKDLIEEEE